MMSTWDTLLSWVQYLSRDARTQFQQLRSEAKEDPRTLLLYTLACLLSIVVFHALIVRSLRRPLPPGPKVRTIPSQEPWKMYHTWARDSGPIMTITSVSQQILLLTNINAVMDLFERRSLIYCNRPYWPMADLLGRQDNVGFTEYGERHRKGRRFLHNALNERYLLEKDGWQDFLGARSLTLLQMMVEGDPRESVRKLVETMIVQFAYGRDFAAQYGELARQVQAQTNLALQPGRWAVNTMPILRYIPTWFPGAHFRRWARDAKQLFWTLTRPPFERVKADMAAGTAHPSFVRHNLEEYPGISKEDERILMATTGSVYDAGVSTTAATLQSFLILLSRNPTVQDKAYRELVRVLGGSVSGGVARLPSLSDRADLPYVDAVIQETLRYNPPVPLVAHSPRQEDTYEGFRIPKRSWVTANIWSMLHDEEVYANPDAFIPERFLPIPSGSVPRDPRTLIFGFGRRLCPGLHLANYFTFLVISRTLALYTIVPTTDVDSQAPIEFITGLIASPKPFKVKLVPRSKATGEMLAHALAEAEATVPARPPA